MDYCSVCRRHINGALSCPGCGTPVEETLTEAGVFGLSDGASELAPESASQPAPESAPAASAPAESAEPDPEPAADASADPVTGGRAERRRAASGRATAGRGAGGGRSRRSRKIRARRRNRIVLSTTVGLGIVLVAAWSVGELPIVDFHTGGDAATHGNIEESGASAKPTLPGTDPDVARPTNGAAARSYGSPSPSPSHSARRRSASPETKTPRHHQSTPPTATGGSSSGRSASAHPTTKAPSPDPATPSASPTCARRFLWWCG
jgi:hypothetical protein